MKKIFMLFAASAMLFSSCQYNDDDLWNAVNDHEARLKQLESKVNQVNTEISAIKGMFDAIQNSDWITGVTELPNEGGYTINFKNQDPITIKNGENGNNPVIGVTEIDGAYYWTSDGELIKDAKGANVPVNGEGGVAPQVRINPTTLEWEISKNGGLTWESTGVVAGNSGSSGGDSLFSSVDTSNPDYVRFVMANGTSFDIPRYTPVPPTNPANLQAAINAAQPGDVIQLAPGTVDLTTPITVNKTVTIKGAPNGGTIFNLDTVPPQADGTGIAFNIGQPNVIIEGIVLNQTVANAGTFIWVTAPDVTVQNSSFTGPAGATAADYSLLVRVFMVNNGTTFTFKGNEVNQFTNPSYLEGPVTVTDNTFKNIRGFVVTNNYLITMTGNTAKVEDGVVCLLSIIPNPVDDPGVYTQPVMQSLHTGNNNARVLNNNSGGTGYEENGTPINS